MKAVALSDDLGPGQELRYLTAHYRDLQGLRMAPLWCGLLVLAWVAKTTSYPRGRLAWAVVVLALSEFGWLYISGRWYERRYGVVREPEAPVPSGLISIMHPEVRSPGSRAYGYSHGQAAITLLIWILSIVPSIFTDHRGKPGQLAMMTAGFLILPRCFYPVPDSWPILLRRMLAWSGLAIMTGSYIAYWYTEIGLWTWMVAWPSILLGMDVYDHWLFRHLLDVGFEGVER